MVTATAGALQGPSIVLSMSRMNRIVSVDPDRWTITAEAGATIEAVQQAAATTNRLFGPDWGARGTATVGGAISTDAGGNNVVRYGNMRDNVLGLEAVLADGRVWDGLRALRKDSSGYDLKQLFIGGEGTLGVVTRAVLRLHPATPHTQSALAAISGLDRLMPLLELATARCGGDVTAFELVPVVGLERVCEKLDMTRPLVTREEFCVLVRLASAEPVSERLGAFLAEASERGWVCDAAVAVTDEQETRLWTIRDELSPMFLWLQHEQGVKLDTAVPIDRFGAYHDEVRRIAAELAPGALSYGFGHVGDGNLHMYVLPTSDDQVARFLAGARRTARANRRGHVRLRRHHQRRARHRPTPAGADQAPEARHRVGIDASHQGRPRPPRHHEPGQDPSRRVLNDSAPVNPRRVGRYEPAKRTTTSGKKGTLFAAGSARTGRLRPSSISFPWRSTSRPIEHIYGSRRRWPRWRQTEMGSGPVADAVARPTCTVRCVNGAPSDGRPSAVVQRRIPHRIEP